MQLAAALTQLTEPGDVIGLTGELGAGKTQFVRGLAQGLGIDPAAVSSPTFVLMQEYEAEAGPVLVHIDAYRLHGSEGMATLGWEGAGQTLRTGAVVVIEWAELVSEALGEDWLAVDLEHTATGRRIELTPYGYWRDRIAALQQTLPSMADQP
jgi:tRNA threonylcarbamoyladenosine biosynthesis protein TsaE